MCKEAPRGELETAQQCEICNPECNKYEANLKKLSRETDVHTELRKIRKSPTEFLWVFQRDVTFEEFCITQEFLKQIEINHGYDLAIKIARDLEEYYQWRRCIIAIDSMTHKNIGQRLVQWAKQKVSSSSR